MRRRGALVASVAGVACLVASAVGYQARAATGTGGAQPGTAAADAALLGVVPQASSLSLTTSAGQSEAAYNQTEDQATSGTVDLGGLGVLLANSPVCGSVFFTEQRQPQPLTADSANGSGTLTSDSGGHEKVTVSASPEFAEAVTSPVTQTVSGVLDLTGQTETEVRYVAGAEQEATATVDATLTLLNGLVKFEGLTWTASRETGLKNTSRASFSPGRVTVAPAGIPVTLPSSESNSQVFAAVNKVLSTFGVTIEPPTQSTNPYAGSLEISPVDVRFSGSPTDNEALGPVAGEVLPVENLVGSQTADGSDCSQIKNLLGNFFTPSEEVANVVLAGAQGSGGIDFDIGGATVATKAPPEYSNPFDVPGAISSSAPLPASGPGPATGGSAAVGTGTAVASTGTVSTSGGSSIAPASGSPARSSSPSSPVSGRPGLIRCVTMSPARTPGCWQGLGVVAGAVAVGIGVLLLVADLAPVTLPRRRSARRSSRRRALT